MTAGLAAHAISVAHDHGLYICLRDLVRDRTGLWFGPQRRAALSAAVEAARGGDGLVQYIQRLADTPTNSALWDELIRGLTVGETYFFRDPEQIELLRTRILPEIIARRRPEKTLRLWSAGCATGEEPYTLALLLRELVPDLSDWRVRVLGTDLNRQALEQAAAGRYRAWSFRQGDPAVRQRFFTEAAGQFELDSQIRRLVTFRYLNLAEPDYPSPVNETAGLDLILCRNVTLYLPPDVIRAIAGRFLQCLTPGGWLLVGPSEADDDRYAGFEPIHTPLASAYRRPALMTPTPGRWPSPPAASPARSDAADATASPPPTRAPRRPKTRSLTPPAPADAGRQARTAADAGRLDEARHWAEQALHADPLQREAHYVLALIHQERGELAEAAVRYRQVLYLDPDFVLGHYQLALVLRAHGQPADAARHQTRAARLAAGLPADHVLDGSENLTAGALLALLQSPAAHKSVRA